LNNSIEKDPVVKAKVVEIEPADKMTNEQLRDKAVHFFNDEHFRLFKKQLREKKRKEGGKIE
jgi:hypothetical protein